MKISKRLSAAEGWLRGIVYEAQHKRSRFISQEWPSRHKRLKNLMPINLKTVMTNTAEVNIDYMDMSMPIRFKPGIITGEWLDRMSSDESINGVANIIVDLLVDWDVEDGEGIKLPVTLDNIKLLPLPLLKSIITACTEAVTPGNK